MSWPKKRFLCQKEKWWKYGVGLETRNFSVRSQKRGRKEGGWILMRRKPSGRNENLKVLIKAGEKGRWGPKRRDSGIPYSRERVIKRKSVKAVWRYWRGISRGFRGIFAVKLLKRWVSLFLNKEHFECNSLIYSLVLILCFKMKLANGTGEIVSWK